MRGKSVLLLLVVLAELSCSKSGLALDFFFVPDTSFGQAGDTILVSGCIGSSDLMRGFTVYMAYDTNLIHLAAPVIAGSLIAGREGLNFGYFDHDYIPDALEVYGTIMNPSVDFWSGPGELFQLSFMLRANGETSITDPYPPLFVDSEGGFPPVIFYPATVTIRGSGADDYWGNIPTEFGIRSVYPNPFNSSLAIQFSIPSTDRVEIIVYDILGRQVSMLANTVMNAGEHRLDWNANDMSSGAYFIVLSLRQRSDIKRVTHVK
jgi:hypothetical protein